MGSILRKSVTRPIPSGAEIVVVKGKRVARWRTSKGKLRSAPVTTGKDGADRIREESSTFFARYRDGDGLTVETSTGCRDESAARQVLADLERTAERIRAGVMSASESRLSIHLTKPIGEHVDAFLNGLEASGYTTKHVSECRRVLTMVLQGCDFGTLATLERSAVERWLNRRKAQGRSARTRNVDLTHLIAFANWCVENRRLTSNPFRGIPKSNEAADPRRRRRAMSEAELVKLLEVARQRPLLDALTVRRGKRKGELFAKIRPEVRARLEAMGRERATIYKSLVLTGLRLGELASLTAGQLKLDGPRPFAELDAADEKNREGNAIPIRPDLAADLAEWLDDKLANLQAAARRSGGPIPSRLPADTPVFQIPTGIIRVFDRDLKAAGIAKRDERGRTLDLHALRTTFGTLLSKGGVSLRTAQAAMRHADPSLTANVYTDPKLLDVAGALEALPSLPLDPTPTTDAAAVRATGTNGLSLGAVALPVALNQCNETQSLANTGRMNTASDLSAIRDGWNTNPETRKPSVAASIPGNAGLKWAMRDSNPRHSACKADALTN